MPSPSQASDDDESSSDLSASTCRIAAIPQKELDNAPATPKNRKASAGQTPKTAPAASGLSDGLAASRQRRLSQPQKVQPTLLTDFFLGRPTQARVHAQRKKSHDAATVKAEMRTAMRQSSVQRLQQPGGVKDRVKAWQKTNAAAMKKGNPEAAPSEPTDIAFSAGAQSVTETDRLRIRARQNQRAAKPTPLHFSYPKTDGEDNGVRASQKRKGKAAQKKTNGDVSKSEPENDSDDGYEDCDGGFPKYHTVKIPKARKGLSKDSDHDIVDAGTPPKKRIVSDDNWMKRRNNRVASKARSPKTRSPKTRPEGGVAMPIPKDFLQRTAQNPTVSNKIMDWAKRVDPTVTPSNPQRSSGRKEKSRSARDIREDTNDEESDAIKKAGVPSWRSAPDDGIRVQPLRSTRSAEDGQAKQQRGAKDDYRKKSQQYDDGIRVRPLLPDGPAEELKEVLVSENESSVPPRRWTPLDDGIRVRPTKLATPRDDAQESSKWKTSAADKSNKQTPSNARPKAHPQATHTARSAPTVSTRLGESSLASGYFVTEDQESVPDTPTRRPIPRHSARSKAPTLTRCPSPTETRSENVTTRTGSWHEDSDGSDSLSGEGDKDESLADSYGPSTVPPKSLADIPVGYSAFSELDLPFRGESGRGRTRAVGNPSFKGMPQILKKVVSEGKKMVHDKVDPPRPTVNQPPSIEKWLNTTVDPFVEAKPARKVSSVQARQSIETQWKKDVKRRSTSETRKRSDEPSPTRTSKDVSAKSQKTLELSAGDRTDAEKPASISVSNPEACSSAKQAFSTSTLKTPNQKGTAATGLKRTGATRSTSSPLKPGSSKKPFRELLREAFRGESGEYKPPVSYPSYETERDRDKYKDVESEDSFVDSLDNRGSRRPSSGDSSRSDPVTLLTNSASSSSLAGSSDASSSFASSATPSSDLPRRRPPPTSGDHELSTIVSVESHSTQSSDTMSTVSESTVTQDTAFTRASGDVSRKTYDKNSTGLKRRLTKHSDLVSVLSLPEDSQLPARTKSIRLARSLHRKTSKLDNATMEDLLQEFAEDENIYRRELKTLASGVIPVLLSQFVDQNGGSRATDIFGADVAGQKANVMSRAVVDMGVALEKLSLLHQFVPIQDASRMVGWLQKSYPVYDNYLDVWRLGFQGIIVNLAPAAGKSPEEDSLVNGMERNEDGDVLDENGERVDVAYLLRRPLVRIKWMLKFAKGAKIILGRSVAGDIEQKLDTLHEKARRRNREETARKTDEDASTTDTTRARDLRNLAIVDNTTIDQSRQVNAKDWFDLSLSHSNGQRLECQVELIFRDKISDASDRGDVLIRETGGAGQSWLLFPPIPMSQLSARKGQDSRTLVLMVRDIYMGREWYELITVIADHDDTAEDWLDILSKSPVPPPTSGRMSSSTRKSEEADVPVGEQRYKATPHDGDNPKALKRPSRYHQQHKRATSSPAASSPLGDIDRTPTRPTSRSGLSPSPSGGSSSRPLREDMRPDPTQLKSSTSSSAREDVAPPPPSHRTPVTKSLPILNPPVEPTTSTSRVRRRTSSPLKHEYHPSDISSDSDSSLLSSCSESESSSDELEEDDVPDTLPGISIKKPELGTAESLVSESSLTPSNSASQAGLPGLQASYPSEYNLQLMASISYWSNKKGLWKDLGESLSAIAITPGLIEAYLPGTNITSTQHGPGFTSTSEVRLEAGATKPLIALDLTPLVMIRQSTIVDLEIRSPVRSFSKYSHLDANIFRFRAQSPAELVNLYTAVHQSRMNNAKFKALEEEARFRSFGQPQANGDMGDDTSSHRRRSWFGRKNSYRASARAPSQSQGSSSSISATSFLKKLTGGGNMSFNINGSSVDRQSRAGSGGASFYTSSGSSSAEGGGGGGGRFSFSVPRSPSESLAESSSRGIQGLGSSNIKMRCHLQLTPTKWEDHGNCLLTIARPPPGVRQELTIYHGLEKRVLAVSIPEKTNEKPLVVVDVVVGSACFSRLAARGIVLNVWEEMRDEQNRVGNATATGAISGRVKKWCFQFSSAAVASWVFGLVASEVQIG